MNIPALLTASCLATSSSSNGAFHLPLLHLEVLQPFQLRNHTDSHRRKQCCNCRAWVGSVVRLVIVFFKGGGFESRVAVALFSENSDLSIEFALQA